MKTFAAVAALAVIVLAIFANSAPASTPHHDNTVSVSMELPTTFPQSAPTVIQVPEITIVASVPKHNVARTVAKAPTQKRFVCGETYNNDVGGRNSDCFWM